MNKGISIATKASKLWDTEQGEAIAYGNLIHEMLSHITWKADVSNVLERFLSNGQIARDYFPEIASILNTIVNHPQLSVYYEDRSDCSIINEKEILSSSGKIQIPDRIWVGGDTAVIIDYKTGAPRQYYHNQINQYAITLNEIGFKVEKKLLVYIDKELVIEEVL